MNWFGSQTFAMGCVATWPCLSYPKYLKERGDVRHNLFGQKPHTLFVKTIRIFVLWLKYTGTWNGHFSTWVLTILTISDYMIDCMKAVQDQYANTLMQASTTRINLHDSLKTMMSLARPTHLFRSSVRLQP